VFTIHFFRAYVQKILQAYFQRISEAYVPRLVRGIQRF
jgi:hypothetical protein